MPDAAVAQTLLLSNYQKATAKHLDAMVSKLFADFTGLHFHVAWASTLPGRSDPSSSPTSCDVCLRLRGTHLPAICQTCGPHHLACALRSDHQGHAFTCQLGVRNFWFPITVRGLTIGIAYVQALTRKPSAASKRRARRAKVLSRSEFDRAGRLLRLIVGQAKTANLAELSAADAALAERALREHELEEARLRNELHRFLPIVRETPAAVCPETHAVRIVHRLLDFAIQECAHPITLKNCASKLGMNPSYLSTLFSRTVGLPFKAYLNNYRLETAKSQLADPSKRLSEVATAVGYTSENSFRLAFKRATGLSPTAWRETLVAR